MRVVRPFARPFAASCALIAALGSHPAAAFDESAASSPEPDVARISVVQGDVGIRRGDADETYAAAINAPLSAGDYITTNDASRSEVELDYGTALRVAPDTQLRFTELAPRAHEMQLAQGTVDIRVFRGLAAHAAVQTPAATVRPRSNGSFRVTVTDAGDTEVTARSGRVDVAFGGDTQQLSSGQSVLVTGDAGDAQVQAIDAIPADDFDTFNRRRDAYVERSNDWAYVDAGFVGAEDLAAYGTWTDVPGYGEAWQPNDEPADWAPYHTGRWIWQAYYGWSWVDDAPWGYAPFHYGRWFSEAGTWYWSPGITVGGPLAYSAPVVYVAQPVFYRPALVAFFSFGGVDAGIANIGWCPLAPQEPYHPWYGHGGEGARAVSIDVNVNVNVDVARSYRNFAVPGGAVAVESTAFASGNFRHIATVRRSELGTVALIRGVVPVVPTRPNLAFSANGIAPIHTGEPLAHRFSTFAVPPKPVGAPFVDVQRTVRAEAVRTYPERADTLRTLPSLHDQEPPVAPQRSIAPPEHVAPAPERTPSPFERFARKPAVDAAPPVPDQPRPLRRFDAPQQHVVTPPAVRPLASPPLPQPQRRRASPSPSPVASHKPGDAADARL